MSQLELADIQGNILRGYTNDHAAYLLLDLGAPAVGRRLLGELLPSVTIAAPWSRKPDTTLNLAVDRHRPRRPRRPGGPPARASAPPSAKACRPAPTCSATPARARPTRWEQGLDGSRGHLLVSLTGVDARGPRPRARPPRSPGSTPTRTWRSSTSSEPTGSSRPASTSASCDGFSQPAIEGSYEGRPVDGTIGRRGAWQPIPAGELLLGYRDTDAVLPEAPPGPLGRNGTYVVYRKLYQDVAGFRALVAGHAAGFPGGADALAAKIIGRWPDGTPLALSPDGPDPAISGDRTKINDFRYAGDPLGLRCPVGAHVRRANPRDGEGVGAVMTTRHRIVRRGLPYGPPLPPGAPDDGADRGLVFVCFSVDLERQFEFVQRQWLNDGDQLGLGPDPDPIVGTPAHLPNGVPAKLVVGGDPPLPRPARRAPRGHTGRALPVRRRASAACGPWPPARPDRSARSAPSPSPGGPRRARR